MNIKELTNDKTCYHVQVVIPKEKLEEKITSELSKISKTAKMDGFRVGKVPENVLRKKYSPSIRIEAIQKTIDTAIQDIVKDKKLNVGFDPEITDLKNEEGVDLEFQLKFEIMPEVILPDFKKISIKKPVVKVGASDISKQIDLIAEQYKSFDKEAKKAQNGDQVTMDAVGYVDGEAFEGGKLEGHQLVLGSGQFIPGFEDQLIGSKKGDDVTVKVDFPKEYHAKNLAGKASEFKVQVLAVNSASETKIDDDFAKKLRCENLADLKEKISENIQKSYDESIKTFMKMNLFDELEKIVNFDSPKSLLSRELEALNKQKENLEKDDAIAKMSEDEQKAYFDKMAKRRVSVGLILAEYVKNTKLVITEEDVKEAILMQARNYPGQEQQVIEFYQKNEKAFDSIKGPVLEEKAVKSIFDKEVTIIEESLSIEKLKELLEETRD